MKETGVYIILIALLMIPGIYLPSQDFSVGGKIGMNLLRFSNFGDYKAGADESLNLTNPMHMAMQAGITATDQKEAWEALNNEPYYSQCNRTFGVSVGNVIPFGEQ